MKKLEITLTTDGACSGNPGPGGYCGLLRVMGHSKRVYGYESMTTNNRMELKAAIESVKWINKYIRRPATILIRTDSQYVCQGLAAVEERKSNGWHTKTGARVINYDLWQELVNVGAAGGHDYKYEHVKGHAGDPDNEECDTLAKAQILQNRGKYGV